MVYEDMGIVDVNGKDVYDKKRVYDLYVVDIIVWEVIENGKVGVFLIKKLYCWLVVFDGFLCNNIYSV